MPPSFWRADVSARAAPCAGDLFELGLPYRGMEEGELRLSLHGYLSPAKQTLSGLLLLVDEAHALPWRLLEELRMISNLVRDGMPRAVGLGRQARPWKNGLQTRN